MSRKPASKLFFKLFVLCILSSGLVFILNSKGVEAAAASDDFGCYNNYQSCANGCAADPDPQTCIDNTCYNPYFECVATMPVADVRTCLAQCPVCFIGSPPGCSEAFVACKSACLDREF